MTLPYIIRRDGTKEEIMIDMKAIRAAEQPLLRSNKAQISFKIQYHDNE